MRTSHDAEMASVPRADLDKDSKEMGIIAAGILAFLNAEKKANRWHPIYDKHEQIFSDFIKSKQASNIKPTPNASPE